MQGTSCAYELMGQGTSPEPPSRTDLHDRVDRATMTASSSSRGNAAALWNAARDNPTIEHASITGRSHSRTNSCPACRLVDGVSDLYDHVLRRGVVQRELCLHPLELGVLELDCANAREVIDRRSGVFALPGVAGSEWLPCCVTPRAPPSRVASLRIATIWLSASVLFLIAACFRQSRPHILVIGCLNRGQASDGASGILAL